MDIKDRAQGALIGMALGEALGAPLEGLTTEEVEKKVGRIEGFVDPDRTQPEGRAGYIPRFTYEDETQAALAVAEVLIRSRSFSTDALQQRFEELAQPIEGDRLGGEVVHAVLREAWEERQFVTVGIRKGEIESDGSARRCRQRGRHRAGDRHHRDGVAVVELEGR